MAFPAERDSLVYIAKLAREAERDDDLIDTMTRLSQMDQEFTESERNLLAIGFKNKLSSRRSSWKILSSLEEKEDGNELNVNRIMESRSKVETEISEICTTIISLIDERLLPRCTCAESSVFYHKTKGDYYRYLAEITTGNDKDEIADLSLRAYQAAMDRAEAELPCSHPVRLVSALNLSVLLYEILNSYERARVVGNRAINDAIHEMISNNKHPNEESKTLLKILKDNLDLWAEASGHENNSSLFHDVWGYLLSGF